MLVLRFQFGPTGEWSGGNVDGFRDFYLTAWDRFNPRPESGLDCLIDSLGTADRRVHLQSGGAPRPPR